MPLQIRRGTAAERTGLTTPLVIGELLYVTDQGRLFIGDGTNLGAADSAGNPGQGGKGLSITGFTAEDAQDAAATLFSNGTHTNIIFTYNDGADALSAQIDLSTYTGNINVVNGIVDADFRGSVFADNSTLLVDAVNGSIPYAVLSGAPSLISQFANDIGYIRVADIADGTVTIDVNNTGDLQGSVFGDDSTLLVDATNSTIPASVITGTFTGNVVGNLTGNVTGNVTGSIVTNSISSADSSSILCDTPFVFETNLRVESSLTVEDGGLFTSTNNLSFPLAVAAAHNDDLDTRLVIRRSRGTLATPTALTNNDRLGSIQFNGFDGATFAAAGQIQARVAGAVLPGVVPTDLRFLVTGAAGAETEVMRLGDDAVQTFGRIGTASPIRVFNNHDNNAFSGNIVLYRSRGTFENPTILQLNDRIAGIAFAGYDGDDYRPVAQVRATIDGVVSALQTAGRLEFVVTSSAGTATIRAKITSDGHLHTDTLRGNTTPFVSFFQMPVLPTYADEAAADVAIGGSGNRVNGMMYYDTALVKIRAVAGGSYVDLH